MKNTDPAFPCENESYFFYGISRREYFAIKAMQSILTHQGYLSIASDRIASEAFELADAMIKESDK